MADEILTVAQAAQYLQVCEKTVLRCIKNCTLTASKVGGRSWRIKREDIDNYLNKNTNSMKGGVLDE